MGPFRGGLALALCPGVVWAEVCDKVRPGWSRADGPASGWDEAVFLFTSAPGLILLALVGISLASGRRGLAAFAAAMGLALGAMRAIDAVRPDTVAAFAAQEGCLGPQGVALTFVFVLAALAGSVAIRRPVRRGVRT